MISLRFFPLKSADIRGEGTRDARLRMSAGEATDGRAVYGHVITNFSGMGRFTYPRCFAGALRAPELRYYFYNIN